MSVLDSNSNIVIIHGKTNDYFFNEDCEELTLNDFLFLELKKLGYRRIVYYNTKRKLYFYDLESKQLTLKPDTFKRETKFQSKINLGPFKKQEKVESTNTDSSNTNESDSTLHLGRMTDTVVLVRLEAIVKDSKIKTAVIFSNADEYIRYFAADDVSTRTRLVNVQNSWSSLDVENENKVIFIFPSTINPTQLETEYANYPLYTTYLKSYVKDQKRTIHITHPSLGELRALLNNQRLTKNLKYNIQDSKKITKQLSTYIQKNQLTNIDLLKQMNRIVKDKLELNTQELNNNFPIGKKVNVMDELNGLIGMNNVKRMLKSLIARNTVASANNETLYINRLTSKAKVNNNFNLHYVLVGNPGTGKTTVAKLLGDAFSHLDLLPSGHLVKTTRNDLVGGYVGETAIKTQEVINRAIGGVLFVDEAYSLFSTSEHDYGREAIDTIVENMSNYNGQFSVVLAGYKKEMEDMLKNANPGLARRFKDVIEIEDYTSEELLEIFKFHLKEKDLLIDREFENVISLIIKDKLKNKDKNWGNAGEIVKLVEITYDAWCCSNQIKEDDKPLFTKECLIEGLLKYKDIEDETIDLDTLLSELDELIGIDIVKDQVKKIATTIEFDSITNAGHYIFYGNPGTGKTTVARLMGKIFNQLGILSSPEVVETSAANFIAGYVGQSREKTKKILNDSLGKVLLIDEAYSLTPKDGNSFGQEAIDEILKFMEDNRDKISIIFTGYDKEMAEFLNSNSGLESRITNKLYFENYNSEQLTRILLYMASNLGLKPNEDFIKEAYKIFEYNLKKRKSNFGNARFVRTLLEKSKREKNQRLKNLYKTKDNVPKDELPILTKDDIPKESEYRYE